jgi:hypothetical protein
VYRQAHGKKSPLAKAQSIDSRLAILGAQERFAGVLDQPNFGRPLICALPELAPSLEDSNSEALQTKIWLESGVLCSA